MDNGTPKSTATKNVPWPSGRRAWTDSGARVIGRDHRRRPVARLFVRQSFRRRRDSTTGGQMVPRGIRLGRRRQGSPGPVLVYRCGLGGAYGSKGRRIIRQLSEKPFAGSYGDRRNHRGRVVARVLGACVTYTHENPVWNVRTRRTVRDRRVWR